MKCPRCQHENPSDSAFCDECGVRLESACPACDETNRPGAKFCRKCGQELRGTVAAPPATTDFASLESYTPKHLAERILTSRAALEGERKQVTVLFADLKGSMELLAHRDPEEARKILDPVLEHMMEAVHRYEGTVNQVMGDGIMALFGAPIAHEDHAVRACYAALRMQESVQRFAAGVRRSHGVSVQIRIGLNSGDVVVRAIGSDLHMDYTAVGQTTHLAARMEQLANPGSIVLSAETLAIVEWYVDVKPLGRVPVKGLADSVEVYELVGSGPARTRLQAVARRGLTKFVGRDAELEQLRRSLERAGAGRGQVVAVIGEPGVGKSRLVWEFTRAHWAESWLVIGTASVPYGKATPWLPIVDLLRAYFRIDPSDEGRTITEKVTDRLLALDEVLKPTLPAVLGLLDGSREDAEWQALDPRQRRQRIQEAVKRLLVRASHVQPLCLVVEDLQWIDSETQVFLDGLVESLPSSRILLLVNYRPEYQHGWSSKTYYTQLRVDPLLPENAGELLQTLLGSDASLAPLQRLLIERTEGNPFFIEESVLTLVETGVLRGERGAYCLARPVTSIQMPVTIQAMLAARIDRLAPDDKAVLQTAAVIGTHVPFALLAAVAGLREDVTRRAVAELQTSEFLYEARVVPELEYTFKHALTRDVAYTGLIQDRRRALHSRIVEAIETHYATQLVEHVVGLAHHAMCGEQWEKAVRYLRQAGARAAVTAAHREAVPHLEQALVALDHLPESRGTLEQAIDLRLELRTSLYPLGEFGRILNCLREAESLAESLGDRRRLGKLADYTSHYFWWIGEYERAIVAGQHALALARELDDPVLPVVANLYVGRAYLSVGEHRQAIDYLERNVQLLQGDLSRERFGQVALPAVASRTYLVWANAEIGKFTDAAVCAQDAIRIAETVDHPYSLTLAYFGAGHLYLTKGELAEAVRMLERSLGLSRRWDIPVWLPLIASALGSAFALSGRVADAMPLLEEAVEQASAMGITVSHPLRLIYLGEARLLARRFHEATQLGERALVLAQQQKERRHEAYALRLLAEIAARREPPDLDEAQSRYREAIATASALAMAPLVAHGHAGLARLYRGAGKRQQSDEHFATATTMYREMDMTYWLEKAQREIEEAEGGGA